MHAYYLLYGFWWMIVPLMFMVLGLFNMWAAHRRQRDGIELMKIITDQGKDPSEIARVLGQPVPHGLHPIR